MTPPEARRPEGHLVVIDMQQIFADPESEWSTPRFGEIAATVGRLVDAYSPRVTFTRFLAPAVPADAWRRYYERWPFALQPPDALAWQIVESLIPQALRTGPTLDATTFGKWGQELAARIGDADPVVLTGVATDCCVLSTALAAADAGRHVVIVGDACAGADDAAHGQALAIMRLYAPLIDVVDSAYLLGS